MRQCCLWKFLSHTAELYFPFGLVHTISLRDKDEVKVVQKETVLEPKVGARSRL